MPRVEPEELATRNPYEYVRVSFPLDWMLAEEATKELEPYKSPNGTLKALPATNRLEAMDVVVNLREIYHLVKTEQSPKSQERLVKDFQLRYAKAADVAEQVHSLVGGELKIPGAREGSAQEKAAENARRMQGMGGPMMMQPGQPQPGQPGQPQPGGPQAKPGKEVSIVVNPRNNSILAVAPPDKMAVIAKAIKILDVARGEEEPLMAGVMKTQVYRLASLDPETLVKTLEEMGNLSPTARLQADAKNRLMIATAPLADHLMIGALVKKLDGSERKFKVIQLRRLEADYVAGTVKIMMVGEKPKEKRPRYYFFDSFNSDKKEEPTNRFRVEADVEHNRLLLFANPIELQEVENLLVQLGEMPADGGNRGTTRVVELPPGKEADEFLEQIRRKWSTVAPNPLILPPAEKAEKPETGAGKPVQKSGREESPRQENPPREKAPAAAAPARVTAAARAVGSGPGTVPIFAAETTSPFRKSFAATKMGLSPSAETVFEISERLVHVSGATCRGEPAGPRPRRGVYRGKSRSRQNFARQGPHAQGSRRRTLGPPRGSEPG